MFDSVKRATLIQHHCAARSAQRVVRLGPPADGVLPVGAVAGIAAAVTVVAAPVIGIVPRRRRPATR